MNRTPSALLALLAVLTATVWAAPGSGAPEPVTLHVVMSSTGPFAQAGAEMTTGVKLFVDYANKTGGIGGRPIQLEMLDDKSDPKVAVQLYAELAEKHPAIVLGSSTVGTCAAVAAIVESTPIVQYCFSPGYLPKANSFAFAASVSVSTVLPVMLKYAQARGWRRLAMLTSTDATGILTDKLLPDMIKARPDPGMTLVGNEHFNPLDISVAAQVARIKAADPQVIFTAAVGPVFGTLLRALSDAGVTVPLLTSTANMNVEQMASYRSFLPSEVLFNGFAYQLGGGRVPAALKAPVQAYLNSTRAAGVRPNPLSVDGWDTAQLAVAALRKLGPDASAAAVHDYLENLSGFAGATGVYDMRIGDQHGLTEQSVVVVRWDPLANDFVAVSRQGGAPLK